MVEEEEKELDNLFHYQDLPLEALLQVEVEEAAVLAVLEAAI